MNNKRIENLTYLRGIATLVVMLFHVTTIYDDKYLGGIFTPGWSGVEMFFVLSGFLMIYTYNQSTTVGDFILKRVKRIVPAYWIYTLTIFIVQYLLLKFSDFLFVGWAYQEGMSLKEMIPNLLKALFLIPVNKSFLLPTAWTLSYEVLFYLLCLVLICRGKKTFYLTMSIWSIGSVINIAIGFSNEWISFVFSQYSLEFVMGILVAELVINDKLGKIAGYVATLIGTILICVSWLMTITSCIDTQLFRLYVFGIPSAILLYGLCALELKATNKIKWKDGLIKRFIRFIAKISYSLYLMHYVIAWIIYRLLFETVNNISEFASRIPITIVILMVVIIVICTSWILNAFVEEKNYKMHVA